MRKIRLLAVIIAALPGLMACQSARNNQESHYEKPLQKSWAIAPAEAVQAQGEALSQAAFSHEGWTPARVPGTILHHLKKNGEYANLYSGKNMQQVDTTQFRQPWWYRREFKVADKNGHFNLLLKGINYKADVWLNGTQIADKEKVNNAFRQYRLPVDQQIKQGSNILAIKVYPPQPGDFSIGFVDWNPTPPDQNMGVFRDVILKKSGAVSMKKPFVVSEVDTSTLEQASLTVSVRLANQSDKPVNGKLTIETQGKTLKQDVDIAAASEKQIRFTPQNFSDLDINQPELWWPAEMGKPALHTLRARFETAQGVSDQQKIKYGIRSVSDYYTEDGHRGFKINGKKILIKGGGWVDDLMLGNTEENLLAQLEYVRHMNLNTVRLEGFWGKDHSMYTMCDSLGILLMAGWSCHWEWENYLGAETHPDWGGILSQEDIKLMSKAWRDQVVWLRNHPSIFTWLGGSDMYPKPELEQRYLNIFEKYDSTRVFMPSAKEWENPLSGPSGSKMRGPYAYTPPVYWYTDTMYGGAFGFNSETGPGAQVPVYESIAKMIPEENLWPPDAMWEYHCGRNEFNTLSRYNKALEKRYGWPGNVKDYAMKAQVLNYELMRPMFEAFSANKFKATGVIQWMLNSAWPEMYWQLYDSYLMPTGAFYAARKAAAPLRLLYNYGNHGIYISNDNPRKAHDALKASIEILTLNGETVHKHQVGTKISGATAKKIYTISEYLPDDNNVRFVRLNLLKNKEIIHRNLYWLSGKKDKLDYKTTVKPWNYYTPSAQYADFTALNKLPEVHLDAEVKIKSTKQGKEITVHLNNKTGHTAFFNELVIKAKNTGKVVTPVFWPDNFVTLFPKEKRTLTATVKTKTPLQVDIRGWNAATETLN